MKRLIVLMLILLSSVLAFPAKYYLAPTGNDGNLGTISSPWFTLEKAWTVVAAGDTIYLRGGTYLLTGGQYLIGANGAAGNLIKIWSYPGETPTLASHSSYNENELVWFAGSEYIHVKGLSIIGAPQRSGEYGYSGMKCYGVKHCIFERINYHHSAAPFDFTGDCDDNLILNCDFHHNADPLSTIAYGNADGLDIHFIDPGNSNTVRGCRSWNNSDDGFDCWYNESYIWFDSCWSWNNGYIPGTQTSAGDGCGFKFGATETDHGDTVLRKVTRCIAFDNRNFGFTENNTKAAIQYYNNVAFRNGDVGYVVNASGWGHDLPTVLRNNIAYMNGTNTFIEGDRTIQSNNSWNGTVIVTAADFVSTDTSAIDVSRASSGNLPATTFLSLIEGSDLINAGINTGLSYLGNAPDIGTWEYGSSGGTSTASGSLIRSYNKTVKYNNKPVKR